MGYISFVAHTRNALTAPTQQQSKNTEIYIFCNSGTLMNVVNGACAYSEVMFIDAVWSMD